MKKSPLVMSIISAVLSAAAVALLFFLPKLSPELATLLGTNYLHGIKTNLFAAFKGTIGFGILLCFVPLVEQIAYPSTYSG